MSYKNFIILYVENVQASSEFYAKLLKKNAIDASPTFSMFPLDSGLMLGLWAKEVVKPTTTALAGSGEIAFSVADNDCVNETFADWKKQGLTIVQEPITLDFGYTFVAVDTDSHRLRVFAPTAP